MKAYLGILWWSLFIFISRRQVRDHIERGDIAKAEEASLETRSLSNSALSFGILGIATVVLCIILYVVGAVG